MSFPDCASLHPGYETRNGRPKDRPHPCPFLDRTGFAFDMTVFCWRALPSLSRAEKTWAPRCAARTGAFGDENTAKLAQRTPSPRRGEGWGEGVRTPEHILGVSTPSSCPFSPISAFTRVFDALWGRRDAACRPRHSRR